MTLEIAGVLAWKVQLGMLIFISRDDRSGAIRGPKRRVRCLASPNNFVIGIFIFGHEFFFFPRGWTKAPVSLTAGKCLGINGSWISSPDTPNMTSRAPTHTLLTPQDALSIRKATISIPNAPMHHSSLKDSTFPTPPLQPPTPHSQSPKRALPSLHSHRS
ncbi:hypothetical protein BCR34DRAFT_187199 [Clohesyomyces aquaticus]|uniref:Uncharacterized protein n=1 Tax=Clohesyomyces aquaticus TaxID=1231657 RepID=A0A1Y1YCX1_9PLEO|nr:hypothetical protein BCR34DRAFT_187199 [Clohesyomyces aquaticus]